MAGINLSQSIQEKQAQTRVKALDQGLILTLAGFGVLLLVFGGAHWYVGVLNQEMTELDSTVLSRTVGLKGKAVDRVADFSSRVKYIETHLQSEPNPTELLQELERFTLPFVQITRYEYQNKDGQIIVGGEAASLKEVAQQMLSFKHLTGVSQVTVGKLENTKENRVAFELSIKKEAKKP